MGVLVSVLDYNGKVIRVCCLHDYHYKVSTGVRVSVLEYNEKVSTAVLFQPLIKM